MTTGVFGLAALLLLAHVLADFVFQTGAMVTHKRRPAVFAAHIAIVFVLSLAALGPTGAKSQALPLALAVALAHALIDAVKTWALPAPLRDGLSAFMADQAAHLASIAALALLWPGALAGSIWAPHMDLLGPAAAWGSGAVLAVFAGGHAIGLLMGRYRGSLDQDSLPDAGRLIGQLERALIFLLVAIGQTTAIGFLIAAKSILRFDTAKEQKAGEYVIIGTLASFGWALLCAVAAEALARAATPGP